MIAPPCLVFRCYYSGVVQPARDILSRYKRNLKGHVMYYSHLDSWCEYFTNCFRGDSVYSLLCLQCAETDNAKRWEAALRAAGPRWSAVCYI